MASLGGGELDDGRALETEQVIDAPEGVEDFTGYDTSAQVVSEKGGPNTKQLTFRLPNAR
ncbi:hypothetical protein ACF05L_02200 [Streptomyces bobili]|uniref:hypothetical protein n=1 Tax=Streptomyces bobili TaxID=67280 RepID=UPI0036FC95C9